MIILYITVILEKETEEVSMKLIKTEDAVGHIIPHDMTRIVKGVEKGAAFRKGHVITAADIPVLLSMGKEHIYIYEVKENMVHEDDAAAVLAKICAGENITTTPVKEGKIELFAARDGLLEVDSERLGEINALGEIIIASRHRNFPVKKGEKIAGTRIIPLVISADLLNAAKEIASDKPLMNVRPFLAKKAGIITTGNEVFHSRIKDTFTPVVIEKLSEYGAEVFSHVVVGDDNEKITRTIINMIDEGADLVLCTGGMSVDPDDRTSLAIKNSGAALVSYGAPVLPGAMFLMSYLNGIPVMGLPGCVMFEKRTIFDLILPKVMADVPVLPEDLVVLGHGGLCLQCDTCVFPACSFGKA